MDVRPRVVTSACCRWSFALIWGASLSLACLPAFAQSTANGSIRGIVRDEQGAVLPGVLINADGPDAEGRYSSITDKNGSYRLQNVLPGTYKLTAQLQGFTTLVRESVIVRAELSTGLDLSLRIGSIGETVSVVADSPMIDTRTATTGINVSGEFQRRLPLSSRSQWEDFMRFLPNTISAESIFASAFWVNGADFTSHVIQLDGADIGASTQSSFQYIFASSSVLQDVRIKTSGVDAAVPLGQGAVVNAVSRSGTDRVFGSVATLFQAREWTSNNNPGGTTAAYDIVQPEVSLGGPIKRQTAWFFVSGRYGRIKTGVSRAADQIATVRALSPSFEPFDNEILSRQSFLKGTVQLSPSQRLQAFHQYGVDRRRLGAATDAGRYQYSNNGGHAAAVTWDATWSSNLTSRVLLSFSNQSNPTGLVGTSAPGRPIYAQILSSGNTLVGSGLVAVLDNAQAGSWQAAPAAKLTTNIDVAYHKGDLAGSHDIRLGAYLQPRRLYEFTLNYANGGFAIEEAVLKNALAPADGWTPFHRLVYGQSHVTIVSVNSQDYAAYIQDNWQPTERLTLSGGVRVDRIRRRDRIFDEVVQNTTAVGPRFGATYAFFEGRTGVVRASWNRIHDAVSTGAGTTVGTASAARTDSYDLDLDGTFETVRTTPAVTARTANRVIAVSDFRQPHVDEWSFGYTQQLPGRISIDTNLMHRLYKDRVANVEVNGIYAGNVFQGYRDLDYNDRYEVRSNDYNWPVYTSAAVSVSKETSRVQLFSSYTRQWRHLEGTWQPNDPALFIQPDAFANDRGIGSNTAATRNSLSGTDMTGTSQWRDHVFRGMASIQLPWQLVVGVAYSVQAGPWSGPIVTRVAAADPSFGPASLTLSNGRVVNNPLATTFRFAFADRGEGQIRLPAIQTLNLRLGREFTWGRYRIQPSLAWLNLTNSDDAYDFISGANQLFNTNYGRPLGLQAPRSAQCTVNVLF
jgi:hypothetical protein